MTTPSAPFRWLRVFFLMAQPPLLFQEGSTLALTWFIVVFLAPAAAAQAPITNPVAGDRDAIRAGSGVYAMRCASCHGMDAKGTPDGSDLSALWTAGGEDRWRFSSFRHTFLTTSHRTAAAPATIICETLASSLRIDHWPPTTSPAAT